MIFTDTSSSFCSCNLLKCVFWINFIVMVTIVVISTTMCIFFLPSGVYSVLILILVVLGSLCCWIYCLISVISCICSIFYLKKKARKLRRRELPIYYSQNTKNQLYREKKLQPARHSRQKCDNEFRKPSELKLMSINGEMLLIEIETKNLNYMNSVECSNEIAYSSLIVPLKGKIIFIILLYCLIYADDTFMRATHCNSNNSSNRGSNTPSLVMIPQIHSLIDDYTGKMID